MVVGRKLPAVADAVAAGSLPAPAPAHTWGSARGEGCDFCAENCGEGRENQASSWGCGMLTLVISVDLSGRILISARSGEQERCSCLHCGRHSEVK